MDARITLPDGIGASLSSWQVKQPRIFMRSEPHADAPCDTEMLYGEVLDVYREVEGWVWGQIRPVLREDQKPSEFDGYIGWVPRLALCALGAHPTHRVTALKAPVFSTPNIKSPVITALNLNAHVCVKSFDDVFFDLDGKGFIHKSHISETPLRAALQVDFVTIAEFHMGLPYVWGGISTDGLDCSGLVRSSLRAVGRDAPRDADQQQAGLGEAIDINLEALKRGDLIFWKGHVGIMRDTETLIHANAGHMCVASEPLSEAIKRIKPQSGKIAAIKRLKL